MLRSGAGGGMLRRLEALGDPIAGAALHRSALWGGRLAHLLLFCSGCLTTRCGGLSASSGPRLLCGCGTPTARSRPQSPQMWLITTDLTPRFLCQTGFRASADTKSTDPGVFHRSVRLDLPTATPVHSLTPKHSQPVRYSGDVGSALGYCGCSACAQCCWISVS